MSACLVGRVERERADRVLVEVSGLICFHVGFGARALSVRQTPPPETPAQRRQLLAVQSGSATSIVVTRLAVLLVAPEKEITPGWVAFSVGP